MVIRGVSLSQSFNLEDPLQWGVLSNSSEYFSLVRVFLRVGLDMLVGTPAITSVVMSGLNYVRLFLVVAHPPVEQPPLPPQDPKKKD